MYYKLTRAAVAVIEDPSLLCGISFPIGFDATQIETAYIQNPIATPPRTSSGLLP